MYDDVAYTRPSRLFRLLILIHTEYMTEAGAADAELDTSLNGVVEGIAKLRAEIVQLKQEKQLLETRITELLPVFPVGILAPQLLSEW